MHFLLTRHTILEEKKHFKIFNKKRKRSFFLRSVTTFNKANIFTHFSLKRFRKSLVQAEFKIIKK